MRPQPQRDAASVLLHLRELETGVWEYWSGEHAPDAEIRILRHEGVVCYRATTWRADGEPGVHLGYHPTLVGAARTISGWLFSKANAGYWSGPPNGGK